jgi:hypothetical protein
MTRGHLLAVLFIFVEGCSTATKPLPGVVEPEPGQTLTSIGGPLPKFGTYPTVEEAIFAACPVMMSLPHAMIPVSPDNQNFNLYWRLSREYCAWLYAPDGKDVEMSLIAVSSVHDDPKKRQCKLPDNVDDPRYASGSIAYLVILHNHPFDDELSGDDLRFLVRMAQLHGFTPAVKGQRISISIVAFIGKEQDGKILCEGFYRYLPASKSELIKVTASDSGEWKKTLLGRIRWHSEDNYSIER